MYSHKKSGVFAALILLALLVASIPAARADPGFTLEDVMTWYWVDDTWINSVAVGDVDGDGATEIVTGGSYWNGTRINAQLAVFNGSAWAVEAAGSWYWVSETQIHSVACGDVDGDGQSEIVTGGYHHDGTRHKAQLCVWNGTLGLEGVTTWYWNDNTEILSVACGDVDGDGAAEIVTGGRYWDDTKWQAQLCVWNGSTLALEGVTTWFWWGDTHISSVACTDVDGDGALDIVTGGWYKDATRLWAQLCVWNGTLSLEGVVTWYWTSYTQIFSVACADVDDDGSVEIVTGGSWHDGTGFLAQLCVWTGSTLAFEGYRSWVWGSSTDIFSVACADVDDDGSLEIVTGGRYYAGGIAHAQLCVWDGFLLALEGPSTWYWADGASIGSVACGDTDGDTSIEIVTGGSYEDIPLRHAQLTVWGFT